MTLRIRSCIGALAVTLCLVSLVGAQIPNGSGGYPAAGRYPVARADFQPQVQPGRTQASRTMVDIYGNPAILPVQYCENCPPMGYGGGYGCYGGDGMPDAFGGASLLPDQCGPHYFDFSAEAIFLKRDSLGSRDINFTSANIGGPIILSTGAVAAPPQNFQVTGGIENGTEPGFRLTGHYDIGALSVVEASYTGLFELESQATAIDLNPQSPTQGNLFSLFSLFGIDPAGGVGMPETERAVLHRIEFESDLQTAEISFRRYWVGYKPRLSGTVLAGFRYTELRESLGFHTEADGTYDQSTSVDNDLLGFQCGGDAWFCILQGLRIGTEGKVGIYANDFKVRNVGVSSDGSPSFFQFFDDTQAAFIGETRIDLVADILPNWSVKIGWEALWLNSLVTATDNFPTGSPYPGLGPQQAPFLNDQGEALYFGYHAGMEYVW